MSIQHHQKIHRLSLVSRVWPWLFLLSLIAGFELWSQLGLQRSFIFNLYNLQSILLAASGPLLLGIGLTFVIITSGIDLSVGFVMGLAAVCMAQLTLWFGDGVLSVVVGIVFTIVVCMLPGYINGFLVAKLAVPAFIGTLGMYGVARGLGFLVAGDGMTVAVDNASLAILGSGWTPIFITAGLTLLMGLILAYTRFGQYTYAIGGNAQSATRAGINVKRHLIIVYLLAAVFAAIGGILYTARYAGGAANAGESILLDAIAAVVIGGASLFGGTGKIVGTLIGALIIAVIQFGLIFIDVNAFWQFIAVGVVIILSVVIDQYKEQLLRAA